MLQTLHLAPQAFLSELQGDCPKLFEEGVCINRIFMSLFMAMFNLLN
jgi:hypothetical protein